MKPDRILSEIPAQAMEIINKGSSNFLNYLSVITVALITGITFLSSSLESENYLLFIIIMSLLIILVLLICFTIKHWKKNRKELLETAATNFLNNYLGDSSSSKKYSSLDRSIEKTTTNPALPKPEQQP